MPAALAVVPCLAPGAPCLLEVSVHQHKMRHFSGYSYEENVLRKKMQLVNLCS